jgi:hypothetical protein
MHNGVVGVCSGCDVTVRASQSPSTTASPSYRDVGVALRAPTAAPPSFGSTRPATTTTTTATTLVCSRCPDAPVTVFGSGTGWCARCSNLVYPRDYGVGRPAAADYDRSRLSPRSIATTPTTGASMPVLPRDVQPTVPTRAARDASTYSTGDVPRSHVSLAGSRYGDGDAARIGSDRHDVGAAYYFRGGDVGSSLTRGGVTAGGVVSDLRHEDLWCRQCKIKLREVGGDLCVSCIAAATVPPSRAPAARSASASRSRPAPPPAPTTTYGADALAHVSPLLARGARDTDGYRADVARGASGRDTTASDSFRFDRSGAVMPGRYDVPAGGSGGALSQQQQRAATSASRGGVGDSARHGAAAAASVGGTTSQLHRPTATATVKCPYCAKEVSSDSHVAVCVWNPRRNR